MQTTPKVAKVEVKIVKQRTFQMNFGQRILIGILLLIGTNHARGVEYKNCQVA